MLTKQELEGTFFRVTKLNQSFVFSQTPLTLHYFYYRFDDGSLPPNANDGILFHVELVKQ